MAKSKKKTDEAEASAAPVEPAAAEPEPEDDSPPAAEAVAKAPPKEVKRRRQHGRQSDGKRLRTAKQQIDKTKRYPLDEALELLHKNSPKRKFDETVEIVLKLGIDPRKQGQMVRGSISLPKGVGKVNRVICFAEDGSDAAKAAEEAGAVAVGLEDLIKRIQDDWDDFDVAIAHPTVMRHIGKLGKKLGTKGKMPSPKAGTVTPDVGTAVREFKAGRINYRADAFGNVHAPVGKRSFDVPDLKENIAFFIDHIKAARPSEQKGVYIQKVVLSSTMGPGIILDVTG